MDTNIDVSRAFRRSLLRAIVAAFFLMSCVAVAAQPSEEPFEVNFPDPKLEGAMRSILQKPVGAITSADLENLTSLNLENMGIEVLEGLQFCRNLREIYLDGNNLRSIHPLYEIEGLVIHLDIGFPDKRIEDAVREAIGKSEGTIQPADLKGLTRLEADDDGFDYMDRRGVRSLNGLQYCADLTFLSIYPGMDSCESWFTDIWPLAELTNLTELRLGLASVISLEPLSDLSNLEVLDVYITHHYSVQDLSFLENMTKLRELYLVCQGACSLDALGNLTDLEVLDLGGGTCIGDISPLANLRKLRILLIPCSYLEDLSPLSGLTNLTELSLGTCDETYLADMGETNPFSNLKELKTLYLAGWQMRDLSPLAGLPKLEKLELYETNVENIEALETLPKLTSLSLIHNWHLTDLVPLGELQNLDTLRIMEFAGTDISPIAQLKGLRSLAVSAEQRVDEPLSDYTPISSLTDLEELNLSSSRITDLTILRPLENLGTLRLANNYLTDISALARMNSLKSLDLQNNNISDFTSLSGLTRLEYLNLDHNPGRDIAFTANLINLREFSFLGREVGSDLGPLMNLPNLEKLHIDYAQPIPEPLASQLAELYARGVEVPWLPPGADTSDELQFAM